MELAVIEFHLDVNHGELAEDSLLQGFVEPLLDTGDVLFRDSAAENRFFELEPGSAREWRKTDEYLSELAVAARLLLVPVIRFSLLGDCLAIGHTRLARFDLYLVLFLQCIKDDAELHLAHARKHPLRSLGVIEIGQRRILFHHAAEELAYLVDIRRVDDIDGV